MTLGLVILILIGIGLVIWGNVHLIKSIQDGTDSFVSTIILFIDVVLIGFGIYTLFEWLFTIKID